MLLNEANTKFKWLKKTKTDLEYFNSVLYCHTHTITELTRTTTTIDRIFLFVCLLLNLHHQFWQLFHQKPDENSSHLLAPLRQLSNGKQRSIQDCSVATWTQEPETTLHRNEALLRQPLFQQRSFWPDASPSLRFCWGRDHICTMGGSCSVSALFICVSGKSRRRLTPASICVIAIITRHLHRPTRVQSLWQLQQAVC